jgi:hypothetical protein
MTNEQKARHVKTSSILIASLIVVSGLVCWLFSHPISFIAVMSVTVVSLMLILIYKVIYDDLGRRKEKQTMEEDHY